MILAKAPQDLAENLVTFSHLNSKSYQIKKDKKIELVNPPFDFDKSENEFNKTEEDSQFNVFDGNEIDENANIIQEINDFQESEIEKQAFDPSNINC